MVTVSRRFRKRGQDSKVFGEVCFFIVVVVEVIVMVVAMEVGWFRDIGGEDVVFVEFVEGNGGGSCGF